MQFADERKERQKKIELEAKNDSQDKQEVEKRRKLQLLMLYNQYLRTRMEDQLKRYEELEDNYEKIRDICGTQDLEFIIDFIMLRNKRYNYAVQIIDEKERKIKKLVMRTNNLNNKIKIIDRINDNNNTENNKNEIKTEFFWDEGGNSIYLTGSFCQWKDFYLMEKNEQGIFYKNLMLPPGFHQYKFKVDNNWAYSKKQPKFEDSSGNVNNFIDTTKLIMKKEIKKSSSEKSPK